MGKDSGFNLWDYLYYRTTLLYGKIEKKAGIEYNKDTGAYAVTVVTMFNFFGLLLAIISFLIPEAFSAFTQSDYDSIVIVVVLIGYSIIVPMIMKKRHEMIFKKYEIETEKQKKNRGALLNFYIMFSVILFFLSGYIFKTIFFNVSG